MLNDVRNTLRFLYREPLLAVAILATLGIGIGINAAIFSVLDTVVIRPLPYPDADRLVAVWQQDRTDKSSFVVSAANFLDWQKQTKVFESLAAVQMFRERDFNLAFGGTPDHLKGVRFSPDLFKVLRVSPALGRAFIPDDSDAKSESVVILSHDLWISRFGADPRAIGSEIRINDSNFRIIGVMPPGFEIPLVEAQLFLPLKWTISEQQERRVARYLVLGRLQQDVSIKTAGATLDALARALERQYPASNKDSGVLLNPLKEQIVGPVRPILFAIFSAAACVLLIACLNLANLFGARGIGRQREFAIRASLGASRLRLVRHLITEGLVIAALGGIIGLTGAVAAVRLFVGLFNNTVYFSLPRRGEVGLDWRVLGFTAIACLLSGTLFGMAPVWSAIKADLRSGAGRWGNRLRAMLMVGEVGGSLALIIVTVLLVRSYSRLQATDLGFSVHGVLTADIILPDAKYASPSQRATFFRQLLIKTAGLPGVSKVASVRFLPLSGVASLWDVSIPGGPATVPAAFHHVVTPGYFEAMHIPVIAGRVFDEHDTASRTRVAVIGTTAARRYFPNNPHPIGERIHIADEQEADWEVIGVVGDVRNQRIDVVPRPQIYVPMEQSPSGAMTLVMRTNLSPAALRGPLQSLVREIDKNQAVTEVKSLETIVSDASARWRISTVLFSTFGIAALIIALIGLYSVVSYTVTQRTREIAIRIALGGSYLRMVTMIVRSVASLACTGVGLGLLLAIWSAHSVRALLYTMEPLDFTTFGAVAAILFVLVLTIGAAAASKATRIAPALALRTE